MKWIVCQIGAREHYAVARALQRRDKLAALVTDLWSPPGAWTRLLPGAGSLAGRYSSELADARVFAPNLQMLFLSFRSRVGKWPLWKKILAENALFQKAAAPIIFGGDLGSEKHVLFSYSYAARDLFREAKRRGWPTVLGQIDPGIGEHRLVEGLRERYPEWVGDRAAVPPPDYWTEWREECELADRIAVNSEWSKSLLVAEGIAAKKIDVVPLAYEPVGGRGLSDQRTKGPRDQSLTGGCKKEVGERMSEVRGRRPETGDLRPEVGGQRSYVSGQEGQETDGREYPESFTNERPMRVLFLGQANVRKGIQDVAEAARLLGDGPWCFNVVGRYRALPGNLPNTAFFHGQSPRSDAAKWYEQADVFVLPTHSDGFALTQLEAMAHGLPVIATPCCGEVVRDGVNGVMVSAGDPKGLASAIRRLAGDPKRLSEMSRAARETVRDFGIDRVAEGLLNLEAASTK